MTTEQIVNYTLLISRCIAAARERIPGSIDNYVTGVSECSQQRSNLKDDGYICFIKSPYSFQPTENPHFLLQFLF
ncbi:hypothetical protein [Photorhabdus sp. S14-60]|uniref:hypothetical protein n=1 Tax=Photorhabdus sp. S14-60 TaxID=2029689 RepID=UPI000F61BB30|nr:hypothetical protein [Photorhabdus sp. S14-60]NDK94338.1 hypothetical protein [Photorhabdus laumondii subsp. laumondii]